MSDLVISDIGDVLTPAAGSDTTTNVLYLVDETRRHLSGTNREELNRLSTSMNSSQTTMAFDFPVGSIGQGAYLSVDDEIIYVWTASGSAASSVQRGMLGSTAASHAAGALVAVNPRYPKFSIKQALREEIRSWGTQLYRIRTVDITTTTTTQYMWDLTSIGDFYNVLDVLVSPATGVVPSTNLWSTVPFSVVRDMPTSTFASGVALKIGQYLDSARTVRVVVSQPFNLLTFDDATILTSDIGLTVNQFDIPPYGAAARLVAVKEVQRVDMGAQPEPRRAEEVPIGSRSGASRNLWALRNERIAQEQIRMAAERPWRIGR